MKIGKLNARLGNISIAGVGNPRATVANARGGIGRLPRPDLIDAELPVVVGVDVQPIRRRLLLHRIAAAGIAAVEIVAIIGRGRVKAAVKFDDRSLQT